MPKSQIKITPLRFAASKLKTHASKPQDFSKITSVGFAEITSVNQHFLVNTSLTPFKVLLNAGDPIALQGVAQPGFAPTSSPFQLSQMGPVAGSLGPGSNLFMIWRQTEPKVIHAATIDLDGIDQFVGSLILFMTSGPTESIQLIVLINGLVLVQAQLPNAMAAVPSPWPWRRAPS